MAHPSLMPGAVAVITGGAAGIGLAAAKAFAALGLRICIADRGADRLARAAETIAKAARGGTGDVMALETDVSRVEELRKLEAAVRSRFGGTDVLMNNAGVQPGSNIFGPADNWERILAVNLWGVIHGTQVFVPGMIERGRPGLIINTGSKQGITCPPGNAPYNVSKAAVKVLSESLQHELRNTPGCRLSAHLLVPGWTHTAINRKAARDRARLAGDAKRQAEPADAKPAGAWTADQVVDHLFEAVGKREFYVLCPDNEVTAEVDAKRIAWAAGDLIERRPPLSRWHPDFSAAFEAFSPRS